MVYLLGIYFSIIGNVMLQKSDNVIFSFLKSIKENFFLQHSNSSGINHNNKVDIYNICFNFIRCGFSFVGEVSSVTRILLKNPPFKIALR